LEDKRPLQCCSDPATVCLVGPPVSAISFVTYTVLSIATPNNAVITRRNGREHNALSFYHIYPKKKKKKKKYGLFSIHRTDTGFSPALSSWKPDQQQTCGLSPSRCSCTGNVVAEQGREPVLIISVVAYAFA